MISPGAMQAVGFKLKVWEFSKSQHDIIDGVIITKMIVVDIICYVDYYSVAKFKLSICWYIYAMAVKCSVDFQWRMLLLLNAIVQSVHLSTHT